MNKHKKPENNMNITTIITHSGRFHADEVFSLALMTALWPKATVIRTREQKLYDQADDNTALIDVGGVADDIGLRCDHHQNDAPWRMTEHGEKDCPYSSFGLVWKHHGMRYLRTQTQIKERLQQKQVWSRVDRRLVRRIDMLDNAHISEDEQGLTHPLNLAKSIDLFAPDFDDKRPNAMDDAFFEAVAFARVYLDNTIRKIWAEIRAGTVVETAVLKREHKKWFELPTGMPYLNALKKHRANDVLYAMMPGDNGTWNVTCVRDQTRDLGVRKPFPKSWAGLRDEELEQETGVQGALFCHGGRFLVAAKTRQAAIALIQAAETESKKQETSAMSSQ